MNQNILFLIMLYTLFSHTTYPMEAFVTPPQTRKKSTKSLRRTVSEKTQSVSKSLTLSKTSKSHESYLLHQKKNDLRLPSTTKEKTINDLISIDPKDINKIYAHNETLLIWASRNNKTSVIKNLLTHENILVNQKDAYNQTALHYCAQHKNKEIIKILLHNPQTDASLLNNNNQTAREKVEGNSEQDTELRRIIFARIMLDLTVKNICALLQDEYSYACHITTIDTDEDQKKIIETALESVKNTLLKDQENQKEEDRDLPESAKLPNYADDDFIRQIIALRITKGSD